jgi:hypothetical protein
MIFVERVEALGAPLLPPPTAPDAPAFASPGELTLFLARTGLVHRKMGLYLTSLDVAKEERWSFGQPSSPQSD